MARKLKTKVLLLGCRSLYFSVFRHLTLKIRSPMHTKPISVLFILENLGNNWKTIPIIFFENSIMVNVLTLNYPKDCNKLSISLKTVEWGCWVNDQILFRGQNPRFLLSNTAGKLRYKNTKCYLDWSLSSGSQPVNCHPLTQTQPFWRGSASPSPKFSETWRWCFVMQSPWILWDGSECSASRCQGGSKLYRWQRSLRGLLR